MILKDNVDFKMLKKYGFIKAWTGLYVYVDKDNYIEIEINPINNLIEGDENHPILKQIKNDGLLQEQKQCTIFDY